jgi:hypothetical protein
MHLLKDKSGPGRKSNAEHAVSFYEYELERLTADDDDDDDDEDSVEDKKEDSDAAQDTQADDEEGSEDLSFTARDQ